MEILVVSILVLVCLLAIFSICCKSKCEYTIDKCEKKTLKRIKTKKPNKAKKVIGMKLNKPTERKQKGKYYCKKCKINHKTSSKIGKNHKKYM